MKFFRISVFVVLSILLVAGCATSRMEKAPSHTVLYAMEDGEWGNRAKIVPWKNYSEQCRISRSLFKQTGKSLNYYIHADDENRIVYLIFEDSHSVSDCVNDFDYKAVSYEHPPYTIAVHGGFVHVWQSGCQTVMQELEEQLTEHPSYQIVITGWSMGGAFAHLASEELNWRTRTDKSDPGTGKKAILVTYGCPRLLYGSEMADYFSLCVRACYNFAHVRDGFARLPPESWRFFVPNRIQVGQNDASKEMAHVRYGEKEVYDGIHVNDAYMQTDENVSIPVNADNAHSP